MVTASHELAACARGDQIAIVGRVSRLNQGFFVVSFVTAFFTACLMSFAPFTVARLVSFAAVTVAFLVSFAAVTVAFLVSFAAVTVAFLASFAPFTTAFLVSLAPLSIATFEFVPAFLTLPESGLLP